MKRIRKILFIIVGMGMLLAGAVGVTGSVQDLLPFLFSEESSEQNGNGFVPIAVPVENANNQVFAPTLDIQSLSTTKAPEETPQTLEPGLEPTPTATLLPPAIPRILTIPAIGLNAPIVGAKEKEVKIEGDEYTQWLAPDEFAVGWHSDSARLGEIGNTVLNGHHNVHEKVFENLYKLKPLDEIQVYGNGFIYRYMVVNVMIFPEKDEDISVRIQNARWILPSDDERLTLITCYPAYSNTHRLVVVAQPIGTPVAVEEFEATPAP